MAKSLRSKKEKRLRAIRREMVEPLYVIKEAAKQTAMEAALAAPKIPHWTPEKTEEIPSAASASASGDVEMEEVKNKLKPMGKKMKQKVKIAKRKGKGKLRRRHV